MSAVDNPKLDRAPDSPIVATIVNSSRAKNRKCVLIAGMHRSGTSALTRVLNLLGCDISSDLMLGNVYNERGYWESMDICRLNDDILESAGIKWNDIESISHWYGSAKFGQMKQRAVSLINGQFSSSHLFVIKDPRVSVLLPFWNEVLLECGISPLVVFPLRDPSEVAASLLKRDGINASLAQLLWLRHVLDAEYASRGLPRVFVAYDDLLADWNRVTCKIAEGLGGLKWPRSSIAAKIEIGSFLSAELRHHTGGAARACVAPDFSPWVHDSFEILQRWVGEGESPADFDRLDRCRLDFDRAALSFVRPIKEQQLQEAALYADLGAVRSRLSELEAAHHHIEAERVQQQDRIGELVQSQHEHQAALAAAEAELQAVRAEISALQSVRMERERALSEEREAAVAGLAVQLDGVRSEMAHAAQQLAQREAERDRLEQQLATQNLRLAERDAALAAAQAEQRVGQVLLTEACRSLKLHATSLAEADAYILEARAALAAQEAALADARRELVALKSSPLNRAVLLAVRFLSKKRTTPEAGEAADSGYLDLPVRGAATQG